MTVRPIVNEFTHSGTWTRPRDPRPFHVRLRVAWRILRGKPSRVVIEHVGGGGGGVMLAPTIGGGGGGSASVTQMF